MTIRDRIEGKLVSLTPLDVSDAPAWARWLSDPDTIRYLYGRRGTPEYEPTLDNMIDWGRRMLADPWRMAVGLESRDTRTIVGNARLTPNGPRRARFSIVIGEAGYRGRGLGTEATRMVSDLGFDRLDLREIILDVDPRNVPARRAYLSAGYVPGRGDSMTLRRSAS
jgi:RimJ/RimL family protein N-acetyltransferase